MQALRARLTEIGAELRFGCAIEDIELRDGAVCGVRLRGGERIDASRVVLATGHSARNVWTRLHDAGLPLEPRPFSVGFRVEHPQALINALPSGKFVQISSGAQSLCALGADAEVQCWSVPAPPAGEMFAAVAAGEYHTCALSESGEPTCWGLGVGAAPSDVELQQIRSGYEVSCGLTLAGDSMCWSRPHASGDLSETPPGPATFIAVGEGRACQLSSQGELQCWGEFHANPEGTYSAIDIAARVGCAVRKEGGVACWTYATKEPTFTFGTEVAYAKVAAGISHACGLRASDRRIDCWPYAGDLLAAHPPEGGFTDIAAGDGFTCGIREDGGLECWGQLCDDIVRE